MVGRGTIQAYFDDHVPRLGAALAFYTTIAVAPLLMLAIALAGLIFNSDSARRRVLGEIEQLMGMNASRALNAIKPVDGHQTAVIAAWIGSATLIAGGFGVFLHLQDALNTIWRSPKRTGEAWKSAFKRRLLSFGTVATTGFIMLASLVVSAALHWISENGNRWVWPVGIWEGVNALLSFVVITLLFAVIFKLLPDVSIRWQDVWIGAAITALLFDAGKTGLGAYLAHARITSSYGASGSIIVLLLWCYYAAQILLIGAEFTRVQTITRGGRTELPAGIIHQ